MISLSGAIEYEATNSVLLVGNDIAGSEFALRIVSEAAEECHNKQYARFRKFHRFNSGVEFKNYAKKTLLQPNWVHYFR
jgi:hypothetical protein